MRYRKNINCLSANELHDLREALAHMYTMPSSHPYSFRNLAGFHGGPPTSYCPHWAPGFLTWHRAYMMAVENALREVRCDVTLPYWDWSSNPTTGVPAACRDPTYVNRQGATVPNPLYAGPARNGGMTARRPDIDSTSFADLATTAQNAMAATTFTSFQQSLSGVHGSVHMRVNGDMAGIGTAAFDPIFYLHHANVDRMWAEWQVSHPGPLPASEASHDLAPFTELFAAEWQKGSDTQDTAAMGYEYRRFCLRIPPIRVWEVMQLDWHHHRLEEIRSARLVLAARGTNAQAVEIRAFVNTPEATVSTPTVGTKGFAGSIGLLGHAPAPMATVAIREAPRKQVVASGGVQFVAQDNGRSRGATAGNGHGHEPSKGAHGQAEGGPTHDHSQGTTTHAGHTHGDGHDHSGHDHGDGGHDHGDGGRGHGDGHDHGDDHAFQPGPRDTVIEVDLTHALRATSSQDTVIKLVAVGSDGRALRHEEVGLSGGALIVE